MVRREKAHLEGELSAVKTNAEAKLEQEHVRSR